MTPDFDLHGDTFWLRTLLQSDDPRFLNALAASTEPPQLQAIQDEFEGIARGFMNVQPGPGFFVAPPNMSARPLPPGYAQRPFDAPLLRNPYERGLLEAALGGRVLTGPNGQLSVRPFPPGAGWPADRFDPWSQNALLRLLNGARNLSSPASRGLRRMGHSPFVDWSEDGPGNPVRRRAQQGAFQGGTNLPSQGAFGISPGGGDDVAGVLNDSSLTVEDKVTLMIMMIMKKMDKDIEKEANHVNALQQQQNASGQGGANGDGSGSSPSIDVETMKLKRLIDKRSQMFDMLRQIIDKYNETAKGIIDSMRQ